MKRLRGVKQELNALAADYIDEHKEFRKGDRVVIKAKRSTRHAVVYGNYIRESNGEVIPILLMTKKDKKSRPSFYHQHEHDKSIVIERCDE